jgi:protein-disulfide isomerase
MTTRRDYLLGLGTATTAALAGCSGVLGGDGSSTDDDGGQSLADHPATAGLDAQPRHGPAPSEATGVIVAFEDPSCPRCRTFEQNTVPEVRSKLVDPGDAAFVFRGYPVVYDWGEPAARALEAAYAESAAAHWQLAAHYFAQQDDFRGAGRDQVYPRTRQFLDANTDLDGEAVVAAAENGAVEDAVGTDLDAGEAASISATPTVLLFRDGQYRTRYTGSVSFSDIQTALGL